jgi:ABC-2 type transport system ATP-binding protein
VDRLLHLVGLAHRAESKFRTYSLGMKQRLGIAYALLGNPELVFLDEPTNGLDPAGMVEVRELIGRLGEAGHTVVLSSHLMNEVEQLCDHVAILSRGVLLAQGRVRDLLNRQDSVRLKTTDDVRAGKILQALDWVASLRMEAGYLVLDCPAQRSGELTRELSRNEIFVTEMMPRRQSLESYFLEVTGNETAQVKAN